MIWEEVEVDVNDQENNPVVEKISNRASLSPQKQTKPSFNAKNDKVASINDSVAQKRSSKSIKSGPKSKQQTGIMSFFAKKQ